MTRHASSILASLALAALGLLFSGAAPALAAPAPAWTISIMGMPTNFAPGSTSEYLVTATNIGAAAATGETTRIEAVLPAGLVPTHVEGDKLDESITVRPTCSIASQVVVCETSQPVYPSRGLVAQIAVAVSPGAAGETLSAEASVSGGGAGPASVTVATPILATPPPFDFMPGFSSPLTEEDGSATTAAGSHPYQQTPDFGFPVELAGHNKTNDGHPRDILTELPRGLLGDPAATPVLCTEAQLIAVLDPAPCPAASQVGMLSVTTLVGEKAVVPFAAPLYNMVPPPGVLASLATNVAAVGIYLHLFASLRSDGDYGVEVASPDVIALPGTPILRIQVQLWGDPSSPAHNQIRGDCQLVGGSCPVAEQKTAFLTMPTDCSGKPIATEFKADSWEEPGLFKEAKYESADLAGSSVSVTGCNQLKFEPTIEIKPTSNLIDSPSGLDAHLHQPQNLELAGRSSAATKDVEVTLPEGVTLNPSAADGLASCSSAQIGMITAVGQSPVHLDQNLPECPAASKLGTVEVSSPALAKRDPEHKVEVDPETGKPIPDPVHGSIYLAKPFDNPFGSLLAVYLAIEDSENTGIVAKLPGKITADPNTGQLVTSFSENPELPIEDVRLHFFSGARASLITPPNCATHTSTSDLTPWSAPETPDAHPESSFQTTASPSGGTCPATPEAAPNSPAFTAGTVSPEAGSYSPFALKISREDGSQRLARIDTTLPPGLAARLVGVSYCSEAQIAAAMAREHPNEGILERQSPSCPAASELGTVNVGAGAGPTPFYAQGHVYLAGPYKGAPLSMAVITPAIAGPFDLGVVVVRAALYVDPGSARIHAVSDSFPTILQGIPLDLRSVAVKLDRPSFTLNPTSCDPMQITGSAIAAVGAPASLVSPFQVGGCSSLAFKPKLKIKLKGGTARSENPALRATLTMPPAGANIARASVVLPHSEFLDQAHIRTVCTRVQFAAAGGNGAACPAGSVYGRARAITPLLDSPLEGPVFLRSSNHLLPDLVAALHGQIDVDLVGRIDSHKGGIRTTFEGVPDAPVSKFVLEMQGGRKGLLDNSVNLCRRTNRATALFDGQNGKVHDLKPLVKNDCKRKKGARGGKRRR